MIKQVILSVLAIILIVGLSAGAINLSVNGAKISGEGATNKLDTNLHSNKNHAPENLFKGLIAPIGVTLPMSIQVSANSLPTIDSPATSIALSTALPNHSGAITLVEAQQLFIGNYPNVAITMAKTEGRAYYIEGQTESDIYKFKVLNNGSVVLNKKVSINSNILNPSNNNTITDSGIAGALTLENAKELFSEYYPNVPINIAKTEGNAYYIEGQTESDIYKFKVLNNGDILLNKKISINGSGITSNNSNSATAINSSLSLEDAKELFSEYYPGVPINIAKTEDNAYYIEGQTESDIYKFKVLTNGSIVLNKQISTGNNYNNNATTSSQTPAASTGSNLSLEDAKQVFSSNHPDISIDIAKTEGNAYYIEGQSGNDIHKMKILTDGTIVLDKTITKGGSNGSGSYNNNSYRNNGNNNYSNNNYRK